LYLDTPDNGEETETLAQEKGKGKDHHITGHEGPDWE
jgi:hypothetical protein